MADSSGPVTMSLEDFDAMARKAAAPPPADQTGATVPIQPLFQGSAPMSLEDFDAMAKKAAAPPAAPPKSQVGSAITYGDDAAGPDRTGTIAGVTKDGHYTLTDGTSVGPSNMRQITDAPVPSMLSRDALPWSSGHAAWDAGRAAALQKELSDPNHYATSFVSGHEPNTNLAHSAFGYGAINAIPGVNLLKNTWMPEQQKVENAYLTQHKDEANAGNAVGTIATVLATRRLPPLARVGVGAGEGALAGAATDDHSPAMKVGDVSIPNRITNGALGATAGGLTAGVFEVAPKVYPALAKHLPAQFTPAAITGSIAGLIMNPGIVADAAKFAIAHPYETAGALGSALVGKLGLSPILSTEAGKLAPTIPQMISKPKPPWSQ